MEDVKKSGVSTAEICKANRLSVKEVKLITSLNYEINLLEGVSG